VSLVIPDDAKRLDSDLRSILEGNSLHEAQYTALTRSGGGFPALIYGSPIVSEGETVGLRCVVVDISELKRHERALENMNEELEERVRERTLELQKTNDRLREEIEHRRLAEAAAKKSEQLFRAIFESARDSIFVKDRDLRYTLVNPEMERIMGLDSDAIQGGTDADLYGTRTAKHLAAVDKRVLAGATVEEEHSRDINSVSLAFHDIRVPIRDLHGNVTGLCGISRNITERKRLSSVKPAAVKNYKSAAMKETIKEASQAAATESIVLLLGESGSGKDHMAKWIHENSDRSDGPFFTMNCAALAPDLAEAELFGHEAGAFTGARGRVRGLLELAEGGTLLLNEIGELSGPLQAKLLTFLDSREFIRVGGRKPISVNARIIAATNRDLKKAVEEGSFRNDLYFRINVLTITVPPLRERREDIPLLAVFILERLAFELQLPQAPEITAEGVKRLMEYDWPGNVRELRNVLERALIVSDGASLDFEELASSESRISDWSWQVGFPPSAPLPDLLKNLREEIVEEALRRTEGHKQDAAKLLGISRYTLRRYLS
jgi:PAS domain S-box-containing protein